MKAAFEPPKLSLWPFLVADLSLLAVAYWIGSTAGPEPSPAALWSTVICVSLGAILIGIPLVVNFTRRQELALAERQREVAALAETTSSSAEQLGIAVAGLGQLTEALQKAAKHVDHFPQRLQERVNEFKAQLNEVNVNENEALSQELNALRASETERLEVLAERIQKLVTEWPAQEGEARRQWSTLMAQAGRQWEEPATRLPRELAAWEGRVARLLENWRPAAPAPAVVPAPIPLPTPSPVAPVENPLIERESGPLALEVPPAPSEVPNTPLAAADPLAADGAPVEMPGLVAESAPVTRKKSGRRSSHDLLQGDLGFEVEDYTDEGVPSLSVDGRTRVIATAYIGIGNKLYVRGEGPGLQPDRGVALQFISIGKWRWETEEANAPVTLSFWKNDVERATNVEAITLDPCYQQEVKLTF